MPKQKPIQAELSDGKLTRESIVDAALDLTKRRGVGFTMRELSAELSVSTMAAYRHFKNRDDLILEIVDHVIGIVLSPRALTRLNDTKRPWHERLEAFCVHIFDIYIRYPGISQEILLGAAYSPNGIKLVSILINFLTAQGLSARRSAEILHAVSIFICQSATLEYARFLGESNNDRVVKATRAYAAEMPELAEFVGVIENVSVKERMLNGLALFSTAVQAEINALARNGE